MVLLYSFLLDSVEIVSTVLAGTKIELDRNNQSGNTADIYIDFSVDSLKIPAVGQEIIIQRGVAVATETTKFKGEVKKIKIDGNKYVLTCKDKLNQLKYNLFTKSYDKNIDTEAGEFSAIFQDIVEDGGFTASVVASGTAVGDLTIDKFISKRQSRLDRMNVISKILNWVFFYDYENDWVRLEPKGTTVFTTPLVVGSNIYNVLRWDEDLESMRNSLTIDGAFEEDTREETETGDGTTAEYNFDFTPETTNCTVGGVLQVRGVSGSTTTFDYSVDKENRTYTFESGSIPAGSAAIVMSYTTRIPVPVSGKDPSSIAKYRLEQEDAFNFKDLVTVNDAETRLSQLLELLKDAEISTTILTDEYAVEPGMKIQIEDANNPTKSGEYIVQSVVINYPEPVDSIKIGTEIFDVTKLFMTINERLRAIEIKDNGLIEQLVHLIQFNRTINYKRRYMKVESRDITGTHIVGHPVYSGVGTYPIGVGGSFSIIKVAQGNNVYKELIYDDDFYDPAASSFTTWDTAAQSILVEHYYPGGEMITKALDIGHIYANFTVSTGTVTGTNPPAVYNLFISGDGKSTWQAVTEDVKTNFTSIDGTGIHLKIESDDFSHNPTFTNSTDSFGNINGPAIQIIFGDL